MEYIDWVGRKENFEYVVPPFYGIQDAIRVFVPPGTLIHSLRWEPGRAAFETVRLSAPSGVPAAEHTFTSNVPSHGIESFRMCLYIKLHHAVSFGEGPEVVIEKFEYLP
jgi:hypothetical protein